MNDRVRKKLATLSRDFVVEVLEPAAFVIGGGPIFYLIGKWQDRHMTIAEDVIVTPEWTEYVSKKPMVTKRRCQEISLWVDGCGSPRDRSLRGSGSLIFADGTLVRPQVQIVDEFGKIRILKGGHHLLGHSNLPNGVRTIQYAGYDGNLSNRKFVSILIRSDKPFRCTKITWHNYSPK